MEDKRAVFWLSRILEEKTQDIKKISERIAILNHQIQHWDNFRDSVKNEVIGEAIDDEKMMDFKGWYREKHLLPIDKKCEYRYHKDGSEITEDEAEGIFELGYDAAMGALSQ